MAKLLGVVLLCAGGGFFCVQGIAARRMKMRRLRELCAALESIEAAIRWQKLPLPGAIGLQEERTLCGKSFAAVKRNVESGTPLQNAWKKQMQEDFSLEIAEILCRVEWGGDETQLLGNLRYAVEQLQTMAGEKAQQQAAAERLSIALSASAVALVVIILL